jgi:single-strand DNA-binding protein
MQVSGTIESISEINTISDKLKKREVVIVTSEQYPQHLKIELVNARTEIFAPHGIGEQVTVDINLKGRKLADGRVFCSIEGWRVKGAEAAAEGSAAPETAIFGAGSNSDDKDGLPF